MKIEPFYPPDNPYMSWFMMLCSVIISISGLVNVPIEHHPTIGDINSNRYLKVIFKIPKKGHWPTPVMDAWWHTTKCNHICWWIWDPWTFEPPNPETVNSHTTVKFSMAARWFTTDIASNPFPIAGMADAMFVQRRLDFAGCSLVPKPWWNKHKSTKTLAVASTNL